MAYRFRLYAPADAGIESLLVTKSNGATLCHVAPLGTSTACVDQSGMVVGLTITPYLEDGVTVSRWVINVDGTVYYQYGDYCSIGYDDTVSNVQIRLEVDGTPTTTYYVTLYFDPNGGGGGPDEAGPFEGETERVRVTIPDEIPTRDGYIFLGWSTSDTATSPSYYAGETYNNWWASTDDGYYQWLYAVWGKQETCPVYIWDGRWKKATEVYMWDGRWKKATEADIWDGRWKKGV